VRLPLTGIILWSLLALLPVTVHAQVTNYSGVVGASEYMDFVSGSGVASEWRTSSGSRVQVGPYNGRFTTNGVTSAQFSLICVDYDHFAGDQWVNTTGLGTGQSDSGLGATRLGSSTGNLLRYRQAAYLGSLFDSWQTFGSDQRSVFSAIHAAIWTLMGASDGYVGGSDYAFRDRFLSMAALDGSDYSADGWYVLSPAQGYNGQEMLIRTNTVPEPSTYLLMGTGLLMLLLFGRKRMREVHQS